MSRRARGARGLEWIVALTIACGACADTKVVTVDDGGPIGELPIDSTFSLEGLPAEVDVVTDDHGVLHIYGPDTESVTFAQGYVQARDRFFMMDALRRFAEGRLSVIFGSLTLATDVEMRTAFTTRDGRRLEEALWARALREDQEGAKLGQAFADGINAWLADLRAGRNGATLPPEYRFALINLGPNDLEPWRPQDSFALGRLQSWNLSESLFAEMARARRNAVLPADLNADVYRFAPAAETTILPPDGVAAAQARGGDKGRTTRIAPPAVSARRLDQILRMLEDLGRWYPFGQRGDGTVGSNNWLIAPELSDTGHAIMANDPHLQLFNPPIWHMVHLHASGQGPGSPDHVNANGVIFPGLPGVILGHNEFGAWGATTAGWDVTDVFVEEVTTPSDYPASPRTVLFRGEQVPVIRVEEEFRVNRGETRRFPIEIVPHHGPMVPDPDLEDGEVGLVATDMSFRWTGHEVTTDLRFLRDVARARNADEFRDAIRFFATGAQNWIWADVNGDIDYFPYALVPQRPAGVVPYLPVSGTGDAEWLADAAGNAQWVPEQRLPQSRNPRRGWIASANNDPNGATLDNDPLNDNPYLGDSYALGFRAERIEELLSGTAGLRASGAPIDLAGVQRYQYDNQSKEAERLLPFLFAAADARPDLVTSAMADALARLRAWGQARPGSAPGDVAHDMVSGVDLADVRDDVPPRSAPVSEEELRDAAATAIFVGWVTRLPRLVLGDEFEDAGQGVPGGEDATKALLHLLEHTERTDDAFRVHTLGEGGQSTLWDDGRTAEVETRDHMLLRALEQGLEFLAGELQTDDQAAWRWGTIHPARFEHFFGQGGLPLFDLFPFPGPGGRFTVNPGGFSLNADIFDYASGASMRHVVILDPQGVRAVNILPGGNNGNPGGEVSELYNTINPAVSYGTHIPGWINGEVIELRFHDQDVAQHAARRIRFTP